ncbi:MAG: hydroxymethylbilane synthase [Verrucomicrobiales bacterium]|jgi:hydroxymethylbilane synthase|nr:hydroxymethylbilane synthase [Verrucomicrobiales bacterium]MBP9223442.1 hydroxymethylbilane synthase [Verrucomicrobiales bacterium]HQZ28902.1 hydroxymethylbilane synthase [Verrucomicrobiales bacterium]
MTEQLILGTRGSELALAQATMTRAALAAEGIDCRIEVIRTIGDKRPDLKLSEFSLGENPILDKGIFTKELEEALLKKEIDFAVHSLKDVPTELADEFEICATLPRADIADVILTTQPGIADDLTLLSGRVFATSSVRRARQLVWICPEVTVVDIRGNVPTRIRKLIESKEWDGILLARAGIERLGIYTPGESSFEFEGRTVYATELAADVFLPAAGQGAVGIEILKENTVARAALERINHAPTFCRVTAERAFLERLKAGCQTPVGAHTWFEDDGATLAMAVRVFNEAAPDSEPFVAEVRGAATSPGLLAEQLINLKSDPNYRNQLTLDK